MGLEVGTPHAGQGAAHEVAQRALEGLGALRLEHVSAGAVLQIGLRVEVLGVGVGAARHLLPRAHQRVVQAPQPGQLLVMRDVCGPKIRV